MNSANNPNSRKSVSKYNPIFSFKPTLFCQSSLTEESVDSISELIALGLLPTDSPINHIGSYGTEEDRSFDSMEARVAEASNDVLDDSRPSKKSNNALHNMPFSPIRLHSSSYQKDDVSVPTLEIPDSNNRSHYPISYHTNSSSNNNNHNHHHSSTFSHSADQFEMGSLTPRIRVPGRSILSALEEEAHSLQV